jgi:hypothetical protein
MRRLCVFALALLCGLAAATPALALPHLSKDRARAISTLVNSFVNDVVKRRDLADGWKLAGPELRGGTTRSAWVAGHAVPVEQFAARGRDFRNSWYATWAGSGEIGLDVTIHTGRGANRQVIDESMVIAKHHGRWLVEALYPNAIFRLGKGHSGSCVSSKCKVTGIYDFGAAPAAGGTAPGKARIGANWLWAVLGAIFGLPLAVLLGAGVRAGWRGRRERAEYAASRLH